HKTKTNYVSNIKSVPADSFWKFKYGIRNELYLRKGRKSKLIFFFSALNFYRRQIRHAKKRKKSEKKELIRIVRKSFWKGFSFKPTIEYLPE
ncbi:MAG TPA: glycosyl transferase family 2, partial [Candidatus Paraprevotella stercorigallinarum]|nr:glycosyl transferase family 2 [Candidatus Paraprevotella stercorigallinarum]